MSFVQSKKGRKEGRRVSVKVEVVEVVEVVKGVKVVEVIKVVEVVEVVEVIKVVEHCVWHCMQLPDSAMWYLHLMMETHNIC